MKTLSWVCEHGVRRPLCSASGLALCGGRYWVVGDDLNHLVDLRTGRGHRLFAGELPRGAAARKKAKPDLETLIALPGRRLLAFPSGSKRRRRRGALVTLDGRGRFLRSREVDFGGLLERLERRIPGLNIEGGWVERKRLVLLQRGSGRRHYNALVTLNLPHFLAALEGRRHWPKHPRVRRVRLGEWDGVPLQLTDGFRRGSAALVSAAAEDTDDPVADGPVKGSVIGRLDSRGRWTPLLAIPRLKVEGLAPAARGRGVVAVTDADSPRRPSRLLKLPL